jgi:hypothetical protein
MTGARCTRSLACDKKQSTRCSHPRLQPDSPGIVRRATPATLTGVNGRPPRACALSKDDETPLPCCPSIDKEIAHITTAASKSARFAPICLIQSPSLLASLCPTRLGFNDPHQWVTTTERLKYPKAAEPTGACLQRCKFSKAGRIPRCIKSGPHRRDLIIGHEGD